MKLSPGVLKRVVVSLLIGLFLGIALNEISFYFLRETARPPRTIELVIPPGTAERVAQGEQPPSLPAEMSFVVGDQLVVVNQDSADHQLGLLWIPAGKSASLNLDSSQSYAYECSFQTGKYFGLTVNEPLMLATRLYGILFSGLPMGALIALYSYSLATAPKEEKHAAE